MGQILAAEAGVLVVTLAFRLAPGLRWKVGSSDCGYHLLLRRQLRCHGMRMPPRIAALALDERQNYPWFYHWLLAWVPEEWLLRFPSVPSALSDGVLACLTCALAAHLAPQLSPHAPPAIAGLLAGLFIATSPSLLAIGIGPRAYEITARPFGEMLFALALTCIGAALLQHHLWLGLAGVLAGALLLLSSQFGAQVLIFCTPVLALLSTQGQTLLFPLVAVAGALVLSRGRYWWTLTAQVSYLGLYRKRLQHEHDALVKRNAWRKLGRELVQALRSGRPRRRYYHALEVLESRTFFQLLFRNYVWIALVLLGAGSSLAFWTEEPAGWRRWLWAWALSPLLPFLLTSLRPFLFLGEAERYLEYAIVPTSILATGALLELPSHSAAALLIAYGLVNALVLEYQYRRLRHRSRSDGDSPERQELLAFLRSLPRDSVLLVIPLWLCLSLVWQLNHRFLTSMDGAVWARDWDKLFWKYPLPSRDLTWWRRQHSLQYVVVDKSSLRCLCELHKIDFQYDFKGFAVEFENAGYVVYRAPAAPFAAD